MARAWTSDPSGRLRAPSTAAPKAPRSRWAKAPGGRQGSSEEGLPAGQALPGRRQGATLEVHFLILLVNDGRPEPGMETRHLNSDPSTTGGSRATRRRGGPPAGTSCTGPAAEPRRPGEGRHRRLPRRFPVRQPCPVRGDGRQDGRRCPPCMTEAAGMPQLLAGGRHRSVVAARSATRPRAARTWKGRPSVSAATSRPRRQAPEAAPEAALAAARDRLVPAKGRPVMVTFRNGHPACDWPTSRTVTDPSPPRSPTSPSVTAGPGGPAPQQEVATGVLPASGMGQLGHPTPPPGTESDDPGHPLCYRESHFTLGSPDQDQPVTTERNHNRR